MLEALRGDRTVQSVLIAEGTEVGPQLRELIATAAARSVAVVNVSRDALDKRAATKHHQGVIALVEDARYSHLQEIIEAAHATGDAPLIVVLDGIQDPQNFGAIARTVDAAGGHGMVAAERRAVGVTPGSVRASAGALEHVPVARVVNISRAIEDLKAAGFWVVGLDMAGSRPYTSVDMTRPVAIVVGSEGEGISRLVKEKCDFIVSIPMKGKLGSLNASAAAAVVLFEVVRQREAAVNT